MAAGVECGCGGDTNQTMSFLHEAQRLSEQAVGITCAVVENGIHSFCGRVDFLDISFGPVQGVAPNHWPPRGLLLSVAGGGWCECTTSKRHLQIELCDWSRRCFPHRSVRPTVSRGRRGGRRPHRVVVIEEANAKGQWCAVEQEARLPDDIIYDLPELCH